MNKYLKYAKYVFLHKFYVAQECFKLELFWRGIKHDWSKFSREEWLPYINYFYGGKPTRNPDGTLISDPDFDLAWNAHQKKNRHHWQWYLLVRDSGEEVCLKMPYNDVLEMVADWKGAGRAQGNPWTWQWYLSNYSRIRLHPETRCLVEFLLEIFWDENGLLVNPEVFE